MVGHAIRAGLLCLISCTIFARDEPKDWPMYNADVVGTRHNRGETAIDKSNAKWLEEKWRFPAKGSNQEIGVIHATPVVVDGYVYFGTASDPTFYKIAPDGKIRWSYRNPIRGTKTSTLPKSIRFQTAADGILGSALVTEDTVYFGDIGGMLTSLYAEGARNLLVPNVPNLGRVPRIGELGGAPARAAGTFLSKSFNDGLNSLLNGFDAAHPDANLVRFDTFGALEGIAANAAGLGLLNLTDRCYTGDDRNFTGGGTVCANPDSYLFWDGIHPTAFVHKLLGQAMLGAVAAVPEPSTYATMALGLLLLGCRHRLAARWQRASGANG